MSKIEKYFCDHKGCETELTNVQYKENSLEIRIGGEGEYYDPIQLCDAHVKEFKENYDLE